jgi:polysaccharide biosynthesis protein PslH
MNVLGLVSFRIFPTHMGGQKGVALFYNYLQQHVNVLLAVSSDNQESETIKTIGILHPNKKIYLNFFRIGVLKKIIRKNKIDIIIAEHSYAGWIAWLLHKATGKPFILHSHNIESNRFRQMHKWWWKIYHWYEGWVHRKAHYNFFIGEEEMNFALKAFRLSPAKCAVITYGIEEQKLQEDKLVLRKQLGLDGKKVLLLFNGTLDYEPNYHAVEVLINKIEPLLHNRLNNYEILITGNRAPKKLVEKILANKQISYLGYVEDVNLYYQAADLFINPISNDTGIKTKLVEAIANNCTAISTLSGASGIRKELCGNKLITVNDHDWNSFVDKITEFCYLPSSVTPQQFYEYYSWKNIAAKAAEKIKEVIH